MNFQQPEAHHIHMASDSLGTRSAAFVQVKRRLLPNSQKNKPHLICFTHLDTSLQLAVAREAPASGIVSLHNICAVEGTSNTARIVASTT